MTPKPTLAIHWFRQDLRLADNPALCEAATYDAVLPIYILDDANAGRYTMGAASRWWLHHSLASLNAALNDTGGRLCFYKGDARAILPAIIARISVHFEVRAVLWNRCYEPWRQARDAAMKADLTAHGITAKSHNGALLWEPWQALKEDGTPYKVFTPFYRKGCLNAEPPRTPLAAPRFVSAADEDSLPLSALHLLPRIRWDVPMAAHWEIGEAGAAKRLAAFLAEGIGNYKEGRNVPAKHYVSRLSPYLHFGEISPNTVWHAARMLGDNKHIDHFCSELGWREFSHSLLYHNPDLPTQNLQAKFDAFPWMENTEHLAAWQRGQTGIPMVDAGMRELWQTGYMHNRVRMIVGSFLVKNLRLHWHHGERWFWDTLVDASLANNSASWQWIAGCGADAAPYFRIFNPIVQGQKFDPEGEYVRRFLPEFAALPNKYLFNPWEAPADVLAQAGVRIGDTYPAPIVDLKTSREAALAAFASLKDI